MRGCGKVLGAGCWVLGAGCETIFFSPTLKGGKLFIVTSALKSQRRVSCEFGDVCFLEIDFALREIN